jgi:hypothetical protein
MIRTWILTGGGRRGGAVLYGWLLFWWLLFCWLGWWLAGCSVRTCVRWGIVLRGRQSRFAAKPRFAGKPASPAQPCCERPVRDMADVLNGPFGTLSVLNGPFGTSGHVPKAPFAAPYPAGARWARWAPRSGPNQPHPPRGETQPFLSGGGRLPPGPASRSSSTTVRRPCRCGLGRLGRRSFRG